jgi:hypothetical protein
MHTVCWVRQNSIAYGFIPGHTISSQGVAQTQLGQYGYEWNYKARSICNYKGDESGVHTGGALAGILIPLSSSIVGTLLGGGRDPRGVRTDGAAGDVTCL